MDFIVEFEHQKISNVKYDTQQIIADQTLETIIPKEKINYVEENFSLSFDTGNENIILDSARTENKLKCYVPLSEIIMKDSECSKEDIRCEQIIEESKPVHVFAEVSSFTNFNKTPDDGGAIHLIDC